MSPVKKIVITGPESSGKTTLARELSEHFGSPWAPEYARRYLEQLDRPYSREDLLEIARGQVALEEQELSRTERYLFCDTGLEVIKVWSLVKYGTVDPHILELLAGRSYHHYLLCQPDLDWAPDPLRETPGSEDRWELFHIYQQEVRQSGVPCTIISGRGEQRIQAAVLAMAHLFGR